MKRLILLLLLVAAGAFAVSERDLLARAENHYRAGNYLLALEEYGEFVADFPLSDSAGDAQYYRAVCLLRLDRPQEALALIGEIQARYRSARYFQYVYFWEGKARLSLQEYERASRAFAQFLAGSRDPELAPQALLEKARAELALGNTAAAAQDLEVLGREFPQSTARASSVVLLAYAYLKEGRANEVLALADEPSTRALPAPSRDLYRLYTAEALWGLGRRAEAVPLYSELRNAAPEVASVAYRRLFVAVEPEGDLTQMQSLLQQAEARFAASPAELEDLWVQIGIESVRQGKLELAEYFLVKVWERSPEGRRSLPDSVPLYLAEARVARGRLEEAASLLTEYLGLSPARTDRVVLRLGELRLRQARFADAAELFGRHLSSYPQSPDASEAGYRLAYARFRLGELDAARELTARLLQENPNGAVRPDLYRLLVAVQRRKGDLRQAASLLAAYATEYPADVKARLDLLRLYFTLREYPALVSEAQRLQQLPGLPDSNPYAYLLSGYLRGMAEIARKQYKNAQSALAPLKRDGLDKAGLAAAFPYTLYYQAWAAYRLAQVSEARAKAVALLEGFPTHPLFPSALYLAGWTSYTLEDYRAAAAYFARLAKLEAPERALYLNAKSLAALGQKQEAAQAFRTLFTAHPQSEFADDALYEYAGLLAERGQNAEAAAAYRDLMQRFPANPLAEEALFKRAEVFAGARSWQQARDAYLEYRTRYPKGRLVDAALYWGGIASAEMGEGFGAVLQWERLSDGYKSSPFRADALRRTAEAYAERGDYAKAVALLTTLYKEYPEEAKAFGTGQRLEELAYRLQGAGEREAALSSTVGREGGAQSVKGRQAMIELAQLYIYEGSSRLELAPPMLQAVADKKEPATAARAQFLLGEYYFRKRDPARAAQEFLKAAVLNPQDADRTAASLYRAAEMMKLAGRPQDLRDLVARLEKFFPGSQWTAEARKLQEGGAQ